MKKIYEKPDAEYVSLIAEERISNDDFYNSDDQVDGETGVESSIF